jgi:hypothetical protein
VVEFRIPALSLDLVVVVAIGGERWLDLQLHQMFLLQVGNLVAAVDMKDSIALMFYISRSFVLNSKTVM